MQGLLGLSFGGLWRVSRIPDLPFLIRVPEELRSSRERERVGVIAVGAGTGAGAGAGKMYRLSV